MVARRLQKAPRHPADKRYVLDPQTAPVVKQVFDDSARGKPMQQIADEVNASGCARPTASSSRVKTLNKLLKSRAYVGEYCYADHVVEGGMPQIVDEETFEKVQAMFAVNKRRGAKSKAELAAMGDDAPDYWLTGRLFCRRCGRAMEGVSGTSKTGREYRYYYYCQEQRKKKRTAKPVRRRRSRPGWSRSSSPSSTTRRCSPPWRSTWPTTTAGRMRRDWTS